MSMRIVKSARRTDETEISLTLNLDGSGIYDVDTGCGFLNHMLELFSRHGRFDLTLACRGDVQVDYHHTVEDIAIVLGRAFSEALGDRAGINRYGTCTLPMDEALILAAVDISGRPAVGYALEVPTEKVGDFDTELERQAENGKPLLGICLGMQLLFEKSYEYGEHAGLGMLPGSVCPLEPDLAAAGFSYKVPHIGWNSLHLVRPENPLMANTREGDFVYFVHSFYAKGCGDALVAGAEYGVTVPGAVARGNVYGCQFHPEKSGEAGLRILRAFAAL